MRIARRRKTGLQKLPRLPLVALIDVVLFILLYFMLSSRLAPEESHLPSTLRADAQSGRGAALMPQIVDVDARGERPVLRLGDRVIESKEALEAVLARLPKENGVFVRVHAGAMVDHVAMVMQSCRDAGFGKISYVPANQ